MSTICFHEKFSRTFSFLYLALSGRPLQCIQRSVQTKVKLLRWIALWNMKEMKYLIGSIFKYIYTYNGMSMASLSLRCSIYFPRGLLKLKLYSLFSLHKQSTWEIVLLERKYADGPLHYVLIILNRKWVLLASDLSI